MRKEEEARSLGLEGVWKERTETLGRDRRLLPWRNRWHTEPGGPGSDMLPHPPAASPQPTKPGAPAPSTRRWGRGGGWARESYAAASALRLAWDALARPPRSAVVRHKPRPAASIDSRAKAQLGRPPRKSSAAEGRIPELVLPLLRPLRPPAAAARAHNRRRAGAGAKAGMAAPRPSADSPCCSHPGVASGVQQTLEEMDFDRGEAPRCLQVAAQGDGREAGPRGPQRAGWEPRGAVGSQPPRQ